MLGKRRARGALSSVFSFLGLALATGSLTASAQQLTDADYWRASGLSLESLTSLISPDNCTEARRVLPCISALDAAARFAVPPISVMTAAELENRRSEFGEIVASFGPLRAVTQGTVSERSRIAQREHDRQTARLAVSSTAALVASGEIRNVSWHQAVKFVAALPRGQNAVEMMAGRALNAYYGALLDPHTRFSPRAQAEADFRGGNNSFVGVGLELRPSGGRVIVENPIEGGPAMRAGIYHRDEIVRVDGQDVTGEALEAIVARVRGVEGTTVILEVRRAGEPQLLRFPIVRARVATTPVVERLIQTPSRTVGYVKLRSFGTQQSCTLVANAIASVQRQGAQALVFDLRGNPGGLLTEAVCIGALFGGPQRTVVSVRDLTETDPNRQMDSYAATQIRSGRTQIVTQAGELITSIALPGIRSLPLANLPTVVLIDSGSASASELVAGALQDWAARYNLPIWIAGDRSFGKGTVQAGEPAQIPELGNRTFPGLIYWHTIQRFHQPSGRTNQLYGIVPDFPILVNPNPTEDELVTFREEDDYINVVPTEGTRWTQPRAAEIARIDSCVDHAGARQQFEAERNGQTRPDYRLMLAQRLFACLPPTAPMSPAPR